MPFFLISIHHCGDDWIEICFFPLPGYQMIPVYVFIKIMKIRIAVVIDKCSLFGRM